MPKPTNAVTYIQIIKNIMPVFFGLLDQDKDIRMVLVADGGNYNVHERWLIADSLYKIQ